MEKLFFDNHMHTLLSGDGHIPMEDMYLAAKKSNLLGITFTDHLDWDFFKEPGRFDLDLDRYFKTYDDIIKKYNIADNKDADDFEVYLGLELGLQPHLANRHDKLVSKYNFDYVIGSVHQVASYDPYYPEYYEDFGLKGSVRQYLETIIENIYAFPKFDALGHLDYILRYNEDVQKTIGYECYRDLVMEIITLLIKYDIALEINTGAYRCGMNQPNPSVEILKDYRAAGGKLITLGADAHKIEHIAIGYDKLGDILRECGFNEYAVFKKRKIQLYKI